MITFCVQAGNGNYYRGHEPSNRSGNCWTDEQDEALVLTIEQARELVQAWPGFLKIVISVGSVPMTDERFRHELFCARGGTWYGYDHRCDPVCDGPCPDYEGRVDGRKLAMGSGMFSYRVTNAWKARIIKRFLDTGHSTHSSLGLTLGILLEHCHENNIDYRLVRTSACFYLETVT